MRLLTFFEKVLVKDINRLSQANERHKTQKNQMRKP